MAAKLLTLPAGRLTRQPAGPCGIDWGNQITRALLVAFDGRTARDMVRPAKFSGAGAIKPTKIGRGYEITGISSVAQLSGRAVPLSPVSVFVLLDHDTPPSRYASLIGRGSDAGSTASQFALESGNLKVYHSLTGGLGSAYLGSVTNSGAHDYAVSSTGSAVTAYIDGLQSGSDTFAWQFSTSAQTWLVGASSTDYLTEYMPGKYLLALVWNRALSAQEIRALHLNPWQVFKERPRILTIPVTGAAPQLLAKVSDVAAGG